jgi:hypothetical protein
MSRVLRNILIMFQRFALDTGGSVQHVCDMANDPILPRRPGYPHDLRTYDSAGPEWAALPASVRTALNRLRMHRHLLPYPEPTVDRSPKPHTPPRKLFDEPSALARAIIRDGDPDGRLWRELLAQTAAMVDAHDCDTSALMERLRTGEATPEEIRFAGMLGNRHRPAHRTKTLYRKLAEHAAGRLLHEWNSIPPSQRWSLKTLLYVIRSKYGIPRSTALKQLRLIREHEKCRRCTTSEWSQK